MKKILHLFSDPSHSALWSRYLRMLTLIALFAFGSLGGWGEVLPGRLGIPAGNGTWNSQTNKYTWTLNYSNLMDLFSDQDLTGKLGTEYAAIVFTTSGYTSGQEYRIVFMEEGNSTPLATVAFDREGTQTVVFAENENTKDIDLSKVTYIKFGGNTGSGSITLDPSTIKLVGHKVSFSAAQSDKGTVTATYYGKDFQSGNAVAPGTELTLTAKPTADNLFWTWRQKIDGNYTPAWDGKYTAGFNAATATATINQDLDMQADFSSIWLSAKQKDTDKEYGSVKILQYGNDKGTDYHTTPWPPDIKFVAEDGPSGSFKGWYKDASYTQQADDVKNDKGELIYQNTDKTYCPNISNQNVTLYAKFECNIQNNTQSVDLSGIKKPDNNNVTNVGYTNKELSVKTINTTNNVLYLKTFQDGENRRTGIRIHAKGDKYRLIVRLNGKDNETKEIRINEETANYVTRHYSWTDFGLTYEQINQITDVGVAGNNPADDGTPYTFYVKYFWIDDIADYDHTFACYGDEYGTYNNGVYTYSHDNNGVKAAFSGIGGGDRVAYTNSMNFKAGVDNNLNISSANYDFSSIGLVFDNPCNYSLTVGEKSVAGNGTAVVVPVSGSSIAIVNNGNSPLSLAKITYTGNSTGLSEERTITVDGKERKYWLYIPGTVRGQKDVPVVFSLHGRYNNDNPNTDQGKPIFTESSQKNGFIVVYPQGRHGTDTGYEEGWNNGFADCTGWEATGKENADTKFIQALVDELKKNNFYGSTTVDPNRFYLCGFSMGGMMTYACAKVLNGTFAAYGSCGGYPLNEFHLNLATKQPVPFIHLHGNSDGLVGIKHLHTIIENLLFRNGCSLANYEVQNEWDTQGFKKYDFTGVNNVPVTTVTFKGLGHTVASSAPDYLWNFFKDKKLDTYKPTTMKWQWDMPTINGNLGDSNGYPYGWKRVAISGNNTIGTLTYGDNRNKDCTTDKCTSALQECSGNHNVYNSIQLEKGTYKLHAKANVAESDGTGIIVGIYKVVEPNDPEECIVRRQVKNNSGDASANLSILYPFTVTEDGEYYVKIERGNNGTTCTALAIHTSDYNPDDEDDSEKVMELPTGWENDGLIVKIDFENVGENCANIGEEPTTINKGKDKNGEYEYLYFTETPPTEGYKLYSRHHGDNILRLTKADVILHDAVFGHYFQNIPKAQFYDRSARQNYMRAVLPKGSLSPIKSSGAATIGFWVNGRVAVDAGLSYNDASMLYLSGPDFSNKYYPTVDGINGKDKLYQGMFNIRCNGNSNGFLKWFDQNGDSTQIRYFADNMFGDLCDNTSTEKYYKKNLYLDRNWHYVTMVMYNDLRNVDMYVDGELTNSRQNIVGSDQDLKARLDSINHIIIGGLNVTYTTFGYDPAFAFDDIVIYSRALSSQEINQIISDKKYSPNSWDFEKDIANPALLSEEKLKAGGLWTYNESEKVYTLNKQLSTEAELTYDGNRVIPAFRGLKFVTGVEGQIQIDMAKKRLKVSNKDSNGNTVENPTKMTISNAPAGQYLRYEYDDIRNVWLNEWINQPFQGDFSISNSKTVITNVSGSGRQTCTCNVNGTISFKSIGSTDKVYADLCFGTSTGKTDINRVSKVDFSSEALKEVNVTEYTGYPQLLLIENGTNYGNQINFQDLKDSKYSGKIKFWSSAPHVAYITGVTGNQPTVKATGVPGSAYIYAELENNNKYDCNNENAGLYESSSRIIARYEIHVPNKEPGYSVKISADETHTTDAKKFPVGYVLETTDQNKAVTLTLGGWKYNSGEYFKKTDGYTKKEQWNGMPLKKTKNDTNGYSSEYDTSSGAATTDGDTYTDLSYYTGGTYAASSEQMDGNEDKGLFLTTVINNSTAWTLPCRGSYAKIEPTEAGIISVYVLQEGCMERNLTGTTKTYFDTYQIAANEPYDISIKKVYVADEAGQVIEDVVTDTKSKIVSQVWKDDGRARAEYSYYVDNTAYSQLLYERFKKNIVDVSGDNYAVTLLDQWNSPGMTQNIIKFGKGFGIVDKGIVRYTFNVLPGKTYYIFSNDAKMGIAGFNFTKDKQLNFKSNHEIEANAPLAGDLTRTEPVTLNDDEDYNAPTAINAKVTLNRTFYTNYWNAICLPYSINRRQIEKVFGDGTMIVLMDNINTSTKKVMFIEHANQDIIAGYPYLIFPTTKEDKDKTDHSEINGIKTRATFGEANSPLFSVGTDGKTYPFAEPTQSDALVFKGTFTNTTLNEGSYVVTNKGVLSRIPKDGMKIKPYRSYIYFNRQTAGAKAILLQDMNVNGFENDEDNTTGIENLLFESGILTHSADVYSIDGQLVRSKVNNLNGLPKGVYIVNGKKYVKK